MANNPLVYLNTAACGLVSESVAAAGTSLYQKFHQDSSTPAEYWRDQISGTIRSSVATFLGTSPDRLAFIPNFSWGLNSLVQSLSGRERILLFRQDYPSLLIPFQLNGFPIVWIDTSDDFTIDMETIEQLLIKNDIDVLAISHVQWLSGFKIDLQQLGTICRKQDVRLIVDATQSMGALPVNLARLDIDAFLASNYKWMNAGFGTGILYLSERFLLQYPPVIAGANSYPESGKRTPSIHCFEPGHTNMFGCNLLNAAIHEKMQVGMDEIAAHNRRLTEMLLDGVADNSQLVIGPTSFTENRSSIIFLKDVNELSGRLKAQNIITSVRNGNIRISFHYHNTAADVSRLLDVLRIG